MLKDDGQKPQMLKGGDKIRCQGIRIEPYSDTDAPIYTGIYTPVCVRAGRGETPSAARAATRPAPSPLGSCHRHIILYVATIQLISAMDRDHL
jgi:hypothetical protein